MLPRKSVFFCGSVFGFLSAVAFPAALLKLDVEVDPEIRVVRLDDGRDLDLFGGNEVVLQIEANTSDGVGVTINSRNNGIAKHIESPEYVVGYKLWARMNNGTWNKLSSFPVLVRIPQTEFIGRKCIFSLRGKIKGKLQNIISGTYSDIITISVTSHN